MFQETQYGMVKASAKTVKSTIGQHTMSTNLQSHDLWIASNRRTKAYEITQTATHASLPCTSRTQGSQGANTAAIYIFEASTIHLKGLYTCKACMGSSAQNLHSSLTGLFLFCIAGVVMQGGVWEQGRHPTATHTHTYTYSFHKTLLQISTHVHIHSV